jgi:hypothetical protein
VSMGSVRAALTPAALVLGAAFVVPILVVGHRLLLASSGARAGPSVVVTLTLVVARPWSQVNGGLGRGFGRSVLTGLVLATYAGRCPGWRRCWTINAGILMALGAAGLVALGVQSRRGYAARRVGPRVGRRW